MSTYNVLCDSKTGSTSDFINYFTHSRFAQQIDRSLVLLANRYNIEEEHIPFLFQSYLLFNMQKRDTATEIYWQNCLEIYWNITIDKARILGRKL